ncbi:MAG TPA: phage tail protein [Stellaceae bacterium]|jgi:phage tail-like protein|nr:phage tail protein [Stellaceae bacterium]
MATSRKNPYSAFNFVVTLDGTEIAAFMEVSGLDGENAIIEYREGHDQTGNGGAFVRKLPGLERYPNIMLRRGITGDLTLWKLRQAVRDATSGPEFGAVGSVTPSLKVELQDETHTTVQSWTMHNAWVAKLSGPSLNAKANEIAIESVEFVCERIEIS